LLTVSPPYSLGKLIDWKLDKLRAAAGKFKAVQAPYSLGKLIDWKLERDEVAHSILRMLFFAPYSLGKLIDWKHRKFHKSQRKQNYSLLAREIN
jgi:hypothetical protein